MIAKCQAKETVSEVYGGDKLNGIDPRNFLIAQLDAVQFIVEDIPSIIISSIYMSVFGADTLAIASILFAMVNLFKNCYLFEHSNGSANRKPIR